jgi:hypothetical protein
MKSTLRLSNTSNVKEFVKTIPTYAIVIIVLICTALILTFVYLLYRKNKKTRNIISRAETDGPIHEVWSNPDIYNTNNIIMDNITRVNSKKDNLNTLYYNGLYSKSNNLKISKKIE